MYNITAIESLLIQFGKMIAKAFCLYNVETEKLIFCNSAIKSLLGYNLGKFYKAGTQSMYSLIHKDDKDRIESLQLKIQSCLAQLHDEIIHYNIFKEQLRFKHAQGNWIWLEFKILLITSKTEKKPQKFIGIVVENINKQKNKNKISNRIAVNKNVTLKSENTPFSQTNLELNIMSIAFIGSAIRTELDTNKNLSNREIEVLDLIAEGFSSKMIANKLCISQHTADSHRKHLISKFGVKNSAQLIREASKLLW